MEITLRGLRIKLGGRANVRDSSEAQRLLEAYIEELHDLGIEVQDPKKGLVVYRSERRGEPVYLCWSPEQEIVGYWYGIAESFAARQAIDWGEIKASAQP